MQILTLAECPQHVDTATQWLWDEWPRGASGETFDQTRTTLLGRPDCPPTLLAIDHEPLGVIGFRRVKFRGREPLLLFINSLLVIPTHRSRGIATALLTEALRRVEPADLPVHVYTHLRDWYTARGFVFVEEESETGNVLLRSHRNLTERL